jgi:demethylmenaquinone methyltransferase/2-methoxy-6-polyprenyl-1,4-benzoquinol methylase
MENKILEEQIEYYRARAGEYDETIADYTESFTPAKSMLEELGKFDEILELACGTGFWTEELLKMGNFVTAVDAASEMLEIARKRLGEDRITFRQVDLFHWQPAGEYDLVFFANWLSHVPPEAMDGFLNNVRKSVRVGGQIAIVDQYAPSEDDKSVAKGDMYANRPLVDGRIFTIVKIFCDLNDLKKKLEHKDFEVSIKKFTDTFFFLSGKRVR